MARPLALEQDREAWLEKTVDMIRRLAAVNTTITADDLHGLVPEPDHPNWWGLAFRLAAAQKIITNQPPAFRTSTRAARAGGIIRIWHTHKGN